MRQISFKLDYSGGWGSRRKDVWRGFRNACRPYDGPELSWLVSACKAPNGSYWALQTWQTALPNLGMAPWQVDKARRGLSGWGPEGLAHSIQAVALADFEVKGGGRDPVYAVERAILTITESRDGQ